MQRNKTNVKVENGSRNQNLILKADKFNEQNFALEQHRTKTQRSRGGEQRKTPI